MVLEGACSSCYRYRHQLWWCTGRSIDRLILVKLLVIFILVKLLVIFILNPLSKDQYLIYNLWFNTLFIYLTINTIISIYQPIFQGKLFSVSKDQTCKAYCLTSGQVLLSVAFKSPLTAVVVSINCDLVCVGAENGSIFRFKSYYPCFRYAFCFWFKSLSCQNITLIIF
jgi:hypothetical protein